MSESDTEQDAVGQAFDGGARPKDSVGDNAQRQRIAARLFEHDPVPEGIGRFDIVRPLGRGGGGAVYEAHDPKLERNVAIKVLNAAGRLHTLAGVGTLTLSEGLLREAKTLAKLSHPNVVRVFEVEEDERGVFVVMELVDGHDLGRWLAHREAKAPLPELRRILVEVARGLRAAHQLGIVHGDIKPGNVLVDANDHARLADFGLARIPESGDEGEVATAVIGTPAYMAPEQHRGRRADVSSDIYSFCVMAFEVLTGERPFKGGSLVEVARRKREGLPGASLRGLPRTLAALLRRGLSPSPDDRPASMDEVVAQLQRQRGKAFPWLVGIGAAAATGIAWASVSPSTQCQRPQRHLRGVWDPEVRAQVEAAFAETGKPYVARALDGTTATLDRYAAQWVAMHREACEATRVHGEQSTELLDRRMACLTERRGEMQGLVKVLVEGNAEVLAKGTPPTEALRVLSQCSDADALLAASVGPEQAAIRADLAGRVAEAKARRLGGDNDTPRRILSDVVDEARAAESHEMVSRALLVWGELLELTGDLAGSDAKVRESLGEAERGGSDRLRLKIYVTLGRLATRALGRNREAETWLDQAGVLIERLNAEGSGDAAAYDNARARVAIARGDPGLGVELATKAVDGYRAFSGERDHRVAQALNVLGIAQMRADQLDASIVTHREALDINRELLGPDHPHLVADYINLGGTLVKLKRYDDALEHLTEARRISDLNFPGGHRALGHIAQNVGSVHWMTKNVVLAEASFREAVRLRTAFEHEDPAGLGKSYTSLARVELAQERWEAAEASAAKAIALFEGSEAQPRRLATARFHLARAIHRRDPERARALATDAAEVLRAVDPPPRGHIDEVEAFLDTLPP